MILKGYHKVVMFAFNVSLLTFNSFIHQSRTYLFVCFCVLVLEGLRPSQHC